MYCVFIAGHVVGFSPFFSIFVREIDKIVWKEEFVCVLLPARRGRYISEVSVPRCTIIFLPVSMAAI